MEVTLDPEELQEIRITEEQREELKKELEKPKNIKYLPDWQLDPALIDAHIGTLDSNEKIFFEELIKEYLKPYDVSDEDKVKNMKSLID